MNIQMAGIDYSLAGIDIREKFSFTTSCQSEIYEQIKLDENILGSVIVSTCNRTEIYLSCVEGYEINPFELVCSIINVNFSSYESLHRTREGDSLYWHLCRLACGAKSQIWGEDQIISQVKNSLVLARENNATDNILEVLFRSAITCAKKIKTKVKFSKSESTVALKTLSILKKQGQLGKKVLVIGNGEVGKLVAKTLLENGFEVTMTLRQYKYSDVELPTGAKAFDYALRYEKLNEFDILVSATLSPHYTVEKARLLKLTHYPKLMIDLAVPRDIDVAITSIKDITLYDIDTIGKDTINEDHIKQLLEIDEIIEKYHFDFIKWGSYAINKELVTI
ncbi:MAG: glutamyl-tRNA reductase [Oscillospiraceae bacterium]